MGTNDMGTSFIKNLSKITEQERQDYVNELIDDEHKEDARITNLEEKDSVSQDESDNPAWDMQ